MYVKDRRLNFLGFRPTGDLADLTAYPTAQGQVVWFPKSPPLKPPSSRQIHQRLIFREAALGWNRLQQETRDDWNTAARRAHIYLTGYLLYMVWTLTPDRPAIRTIERLSGVTLLT